MADSNVALIVMMVISIILLFACMVLSAMASSDANSCTCPNTKSHDYSMYSAIVAGLATLLIGISLFLYIYREPIAGAASGALYGAATHLKNV